MITLANRKIPPHAGRVTETIIGTIHVSTATTVGWISSIITLLCVVPLMIATRRGEARPSPVTWAVWFAVGMIATIGMALGGAPLSAWLIKLGLSLGPIAVAIYAVRCGVPWTADRTDRVSLTLGMAGTALYAAVYFGALGPADPVSAGLVAVGTAMAVDAIGAWPTWVRAWRYPHDELILTYALALSSVIAVLVTLPLPWTWLSASYLVFLALQMASIIALLAAGRLRDRVDVSVEHREPVVE